MKNLKGVKRIENPKDRLRKRREEECFSIINRGKLWYDTLTLTQLGELKAWYWAWLNVTDTMKVPKKPEWLNDKVTEEELIL